MKKLWQSTSVLDKRVEAFETEGDLMLDQKLLPYDILGSLGQAKMLQKIGVLTKKEESLLIDGLLNLLALYKQGKIKLQLGDEDMHTVIEAMLTKDLGDTGKKIHTGRSRNDQIATALAIYAKDQIASITLAVISLSEVFLDFAKTYEFVPMPGYTHMQKAMPSSVGMWAASIVESLLFDLEGLKNAYDLVDRLPLGTGAGYGVPLGVDRTFLAGALGFAAIESPSLAVQNLRGKKELAVISSLVQVLLTINKFASDIMLWTTSEFEFFTVTKNITTGSSIMPQKKNVDLAELLRSKVHGIIGSFVTTASLSSNLPSGYNRDFQDLKKPLMESIEMTISSLAAAQILIENIVPNVQKLKSAMTGELFATHKAYEQIAQGVPFRTAHQAITSQKKFEAVQQEKIDGLLKQSTHIGGTGNLQLSTFSKILQKKKLVWKGVK